MVNAGERLVTVLVTVAVLEAADPEDRKAEDAEDEEAEDPDLDEAEVSATVPAASTKEDA